MQKFKPSLVLVLVLAFINYGCIPYGVVHRKNTPISKETRIVSGPNTIKVRELTVSAQPTVFNPHGPVTLRYSERLIGLEEELAKYEEREYRHMWSPLFYPGYIFILPWVLGFMFAGTEGQPHDEHTKEWGCLYTNKETLLYGAIAVVPCYSSPKALLKEWKSPVIRNLPDVEEIHPTGRTVEERHPVVQQPVEVTVAAQGVHWQKDTVLTVLTDVDGQQSIPLESMFKEFPDAPLEVVIRLTTDAAETSVRLESEVCAAIYSHIRP